MTKVTEIECAWVLEELQGRGKPQIKKAVESFWRHQDFMRTKEVVELVLGEASRTFIHRVHPNFRTICVWWSDSEALSICFYFFKVSICVWSLEFRFGVKIGKVGTIRARWSSDPPP